MIVYTIQPKRVYQLIQKTGFFTTDHKRIKNFKVVKGAYDKLCKEVDYDNYPVWTMYKFHGRFVDEIPYEHYVRIYESDNKGKVLLKLEVPESEVILTNYDRWAMYFKLLYIFGDKDYEYEFQECFLKPEDLERPISIQATISRLTKDMIVDVYEIV